MRCGEPDCMCPCHGHASPEIVTPRTARTKPNKSRDPNTPQAQYMRAWRESKRDPLEERKERTVGVEIAFDLDQLARDASTMSITEVAAKYGHDRRTIYRALGRGGMRNSTP